MKWYYYVALTVAVLVITMFIRIPLPSKGYFNFGDIAVVFSGLFLGMRGGAIAGGLGSALADILVGFAVFSPLTLLAKGVEGLLAGLAHPKADSSTSSYKPRIRFAAYLFPLLGVLSMVGIYFGGECLMPQFGLGAALAELPSNLIQAAGGLVGGILLHRSIRMIRV